MQTKEINQHIGCQNWENINVKICNQFSEIMHTNCMNSDSHCQFSLNNKWRSLHFKTSTKVKLTAPLRKQVIYFVIFKEMIALWRLQHSIVLFVGEGVCLVLMLVRSSSRLIQLFHSTSLSITCMYIYIYVIKYSLLSYSLQHIITSQAFSSKSSSDFI